MSLFEENAAILRGFEEDGSDLSAPRTVDFSYIFQNEVLAEQFAAEGRRIGFEAEVRHFDEDLMDHYADTPWDVTISREMVPNCENITETEIQLNEAAEPYGGRSDGWGFFRT